MKAITKHKILIAILILAAVLRLYKLGAYPALNADEAAIGYNAYSLLETGMDEHGNPWPIHFQSFNDYKPGGYFYIAMPFVAVMGLNEWSTRLPGAILGVLTVLGVYLLAREISKKNLAIIASLMLAISPWHIHFSRGGWEVNAATCFIVFGVYLFIKSLKNNNYFALSMLMFVISMYTYHAARVLVPLLGLSFLIIFRKNLFSKKNLRMFAGSVLLSLVLLLPLTYDFLGPAGNARASGVSIFADRGYIDRINESRGRYGDLNSASAKLLHNKPKELVFEFTENYFEHFWGEFLFLSGDNIQRNKVPEFGQLYLWQFPFLLVGIFAFAKKKNLDKKWWIIIAWLLIAPIPAALTFQSPHALRSQSMVLPLTLIVAYGIFSVFRRIDKKIYFLLGVLVLFGLTRYIHQYYIHMAKTYPYSSQYGVSELVDYLATNDSENVVVTTRYDQPYILFLFYSKYPPKDFQNGHELTSPDEFGFSTVPGYDRYKFQSINFEEDKLKYGNTLLIGTDDDIPDEANVVKNIYGQNGFLYFQAVAN
jgi:4-amino-4-deoxy-L-arabinose transferase-like glycosyltransferase